ncbi:hypothetical protein KCP71_12940 [Salmonella enterica subsp. enterica]|nr:hypothetical protein KCP71_12940 [Salmonella enterica subsp. enterica]
MHPLESLKSGVGCGCWKSSVLLVSEAQRRNWPAQVTPQQQSATVNSDGKWLPPVVPGLRGDVRHGRDHSTRAVWHCRRNGPEIGRTDRQMLPAGGALLLLARRCRRYGAAATSAEAVPLHPLFSLPARVNTSPASRQIARRRLSVMR